MNPGNDAQDEQIPSIFDEDPEILRRKREREYRRIRSALVTSGVLIVLPMLIGHMLGLRPGNSTTMSIAIAAMLIVCIFIALGSYAMRKPFTALMIGLLIYVFMQAATILLQSNEPATAWIFRALVVMNLLMPILKARELQRGVEF